MASPIDADERDCAEILEKNPDSPDGVYIINPLDGKGTVRVFCHMTTDVGGWTVFQRREDGSEDFYRNWADYRNGFGTLEGEFWLGDHAGQSRHATYTTFQVENEANNYRLELTVKRYSGNAGDDMTGHSGMKFSTKDRDNDNQSGSCARFCREAWWFRQCHAVNLNGNYGDNTIGMGINWYQWHGYEYSLKNTEMKLKPI